MVRAKQWLGTERGTLYVWCIQKKKDVTKGTQATTLQLNPATEGSMWCIQRCSRNAAHDNEQATACVSGAGGGGGGGRKRTVSGVLASG